MKFPLRTAAAALALVTATPSLAALTPAGDCNDIISGQGFVDCSGMYAGNLFNTENETDLNLAIEALIGSNPGLDFSEDLDASKDFFTVTGGGDANGVLFDDPLSGAVILGFKFGDGGSGFGERSGIFLFNFTSPTSGLTFNVNGFSSGVIVPPGNEVPEPATWAMMLVGFAAVGYSMRRRRKAYLAQLA
jgi:hypothetical protein